MFADCEWTLDFIRSVVLAGKTSVAIKQHVRFIKWQRTSGISVEMEVTSEIYEETDFSSVAIASGSEFNVSIRFAQFKTNLFLDVISKFRFNLPADTKESASSVEQDADSDLIVSRKRNQCIEIGEIIIGALEKFCWQGKIFPEHKKSTILKEVGLQVWRGAFLLNDYILCNLDRFSNKKILEIGSGVGLTSILASIYAKKVICTGNRRKISNDDYRLIKIFFRP